jgi:hypothetical protein
VADHEPLARGTTAATSTGIDSSLTKVASTDSGPVDPLGATQFAPDTVVEAPGDKALALMVNAYIEAAVTVMVTGV